MIILYNLIGAGILILAVGVGVGVGYLFHAKTETPAMMVAGLLALSLDVIYRMDKGEGSLLHPRRGGHVFFIPAWVVGLGMFMMGVLYFALPGGGRELDPEYARRILSGNRQPPAERGDTHVGSFQQQSAQLRLMMISGTGQNRLATINGKTFALGETHTIKAAQQMVALTCVEIGEQSVVAKINGESRPLELKFGAPVSLAPTR